MGSIRSSYIKRAAEEIYSRYKEQVNGDFQNNKLLVENLGITNKKLRNRVAGYVTRLFHKPVVTPPNRGRKLTHRDRKRRKKKRRRKKK